MDKNIEMLKELLKELHRFPMDEENYKALPLVIQYAIDALKALEQAGQMLPEKKKDSVECPGGGLAILTEEQAFNLAINLCTPILANAIKERDALKERNDWFDNLISSEIKGKHACLKDYIVALQEECKGKQ